HLADDAIVITDVGFSFIPTMQTLRLKRGQRLIHSRGVSPMGWGIPAAIGAAFAAPGRQIVCLTGDGGAMMNLQELQTIVHHNLPIKIFVYDNKGYETIRLMQKNHFGRECVSGPDSGLTCPDFDQIARSFGIAIRTVVGLIVDPGEFYRYLLRADEPAVAILRLGERQVISPRVQSRMENGKFVPTPIDHMW